MMGIKNVAPATALDYRRLAYKRLPRFLFEYIDGGSNDEQTLAANLTDFRHLSLRQNIMRDVSGVDTTTVLSGEKVSMPLALAPVGMAGMMARRGEVQGARAAASAGIPFTVSTLGICPVEEVKNAIEKPFWFQLYMLRDRDIILSLLDRAQAAGCETLVFTVDLAAVGMRHQGMRNGMDVRSFTARMAKAWQIGTRPRWAIDVGLMGRPHSIGNLSEVVPNPNDMDEFKRFLHSQFDPTVTWEDIAWLRSVWKGKIFIKGVLEADDARAAAGVGVDGVIVSNHGGRQLDSVVSSICKLPDVAAAVGDQVEVYMDGGVRSGIDVVKALALGAKGVLIGRPWIWAVAGTGEKGLTNLLAVFQREIAVAMSLMGVTRIDQIDASLIEKSRRS